MEYFKLLNLEKEPFSNSPDPDYFFQSRQHKECLQKLELSLRLRRGLNVVIGEVGTGKTTLCRQIIKKFSRDEEFETHLILDPHMADPAMFLKVVAQMFEKEPHVPSGDWADYKEFVKQYLYKRGVEENRVVVLIIDEGQKIPAPILEILRELLNYETNEFKLLQIVIFAQREFEQILEKHANFADRINLLHILEPLGFRDTGLMIDYRLQKAGAENSLGSMMSFLAVMAIYRATGGYPRRIVNLCHRIMLAMIVKNRKRAGWGLVRSCVNRNAPGGAGRWQKAAAALLVVAGVVGFAYTGFTPEKRATVLAPEAQKMFPVMKKSMALDVTSAVPKSAATQSPLSQTAVAGQPENLADAKPAPGKPIETVSDNPDIGSAIADKIPVDGEKTGALLVPEVEAVEEARTRPQTLGMIRMQANETLSWVMIKVYGEYNDVKRRAVADQNPGLKNLDTIFLGQAVAFPAQAWEGLLVPDYLKWIRLGSVENVSEALDMIRRYSTRTAPLRMIPHWHRDQGLRFDVIFWTYFTSGEAAGRYLEKLPVDLRMKSRIFPGWLKGTVFYANPCPGIG